MKRLVKQSADGSPTLYSEDFDEPYHSMNGAYTESMHVFIQHGLQAHPVRNIRIFEMGFGTGLNALLSLDEILKSGRTAEYTGLELYPLQEHELNQIDFSPFVSREAAACFLPMHHAGWGSFIPVHPSFLFRKWLGDLLETNGPFEFDLIYFDAFAPAVQPGLWSETVFEKLYRWLSPGGILTTYSAKGDVRRAMTAAGFRVERLAGPPGKREMLRASKPS